MKSSNNPTGLVLSTSNRSQSYSEFGECDVENFVEYRDEFDASNSHSYGVDENTFDSCTITSSKSPKPVSTTKSTRCCITLFLVRLSPFP